MMMLLMIHILLMRKIITCWMILALMMRTLSTLYTMIILMQIENKGMDPYLHVDLNSRSSFAKRMMVDLEDDNASSALKRKNN